MPSGTGPMVVVSGQSLVGLPGAGLARIEVGLEAFPQHVITFPAPPLCRQNRIFRSERNLGNSLHNPPPNLSPATMANAAKEYWEGVNADINGMLGGIPSMIGFSHVSKVDLQGSRSFLAKLGIGKKNGRRTVAHALEGGAG
jgi:hypothetical protein